MLFISFIFIEKIHIIWKKKLYRMCTRKRVYVCMYYVYMRFPQMRHCNIATLHKLGICHDYVCMYVCMYVYVYQTYTCQYEVEWICDGNEYRKGLSYSH